MKKGKAVLATGFNIKNLTKIPPFIMAAIEGLKGDVMELKDAVNELKMNMPKV